MREYTTRVSCMCVLDGGKSTRYRYRLIGMARRVRVSAKHKHLLSVALFRLTKNGNFVMS